MRVNTDVPIPVGLFRHGPDNLISVDDNYLVSGLRLRDFINDQKGIGIFGVEKIRQALVLADVEQSLDGRAVCQANGYFCLVEHIRHIIPLFPSAPA